MASCRWGDDFNSHMDVIIESKRAGSLFAKKMHENGIVHGLSLSKLRFLS